MDMCMGMGKGRGCNISTKCSRLLLEDSEGWSISLKYQKCFNLVCEAGVRELPLHSLNHLRNPFYFIAQMGGSVLCRGILHKMGILHAEVTLYTHPSSLHFTKGA